MPHDAVAAGRELCSLRQRLAHRRVAIAVRAGMGRIARGEFLAGDRRVIPVGIAAHGYGALVDCGVPVTIEHIIRVLNQVGDAVPVEEDDHLSPISKVG